MSSTSSPPPISGLTDVQIAVIAIVCSIAGFALIALLIRCLVPRCRKKKYKQEPDDRSLVQSTKSLGHGENQFFYSGPRILPRGAESDRTSLPVPHSVQEDHHYVNTASEEFRQSGAWVSGLDISRQTSREDRVTENVSHDPAPPVVDEEVQSSEMRGDYSQQDASDIYSYARRSQPLVSRVTRHETRQEVIREESARDLREVERHDRAVPLSRQTSRETPIANYYDMPPRNPRQVETTETKIVSRQPLLKSPPRAKPPQHYVRTVESESGWKARTVAPQTQPPSWIDAALDMSNPVPIRRPAPVPISNVNQHTANQTSQNYRSDPEQLSATNILHSRQYTEGAPIEQYPRGTLELNEMKKYGHFEERRGPGTRTIYSMGKDAIRTPELKEYIRNGHYRHESRTQQHYGNDAVAPPSSHRGDDSISHAGRRGRDYAYAPGQSGGFVAIDNESVPTDLQSQREGRRRKESVDTNHHLNMQLSSYLNNGSLKPLDMSNQYRDNWDTQFDPYGLGQQDRALNHYTHPSENRALGPEVPTWYEAQQNRQYQEMVELQRQRQQTNQNLFKPIKAGKKGKGKAK